MSDVSPDDTPDPDTPSTHDRSAKTSWTGDVTFEWGEAPSTQSFHGPTLPQFTDAKKRAFLEAFIECGTLKHAGEACGFHYSSHYYWLKTDPDYKAAYEAAIPLANDLLVAEAQRRAVQGVEEPVYYKGEQVGTVTRYSDTLLIFLMKGAMPQTYRDNVRVEHAGGIDVGKTIDDAILEQVIETGLGVKMGELGEGEGNGDDN